jgi:hypothetical protein
MSSLFGRVLSYFAVAVGLTGPAILYTGPAILIGQVVYWLAYAAWVELPASKIILIIPQSWLEGSWFTEPRSWYGLHKILWGFLDTIPLSLFLMVIGVGLLMWAGVIKDQGTSGTEPERLDS